jgi:hypothetical protein
MAFEFAALALSVIAITISSSTPSFEYELSREKVQNFCLLTTKNFEQQGRGSGNLSR